MDWSHTLLGQYDVGADTLAVDLARNFLDPLQAELVHVHESTHAVMSRVTDMGLASKPIYAHIRRFAHLNRTQQNEIMRLLYEAQVLPQEGFASLMECVHLAGKVGPTKARQYAKEKFPQDYYDRFAQLSYCMDMSHRYCDYFLQKVPSLAMETGFRQAAPSHDLLRSPEKLAQWLQDPDHNPTLRLQRMNELLRLNPWRVTKPVAEIAAASGVAFYDPATKEEVAAYMNYIGSLANLGGTYTAAMVGDAPDPQVAFNATRETVLTNINHNFSKDAEFLMDATAVIWEAERTDCAIFSKWPFYGERERLIEQASKLKPEISFAFFRRTGEKYIGFIPADMATTLIDGPLATKVLIAKPDQVDFISGMFDLSSTRQPDLVYYDHPKQLCERVVQEKEKITKAENINIGALMNHPYRIIALRINEQKPLHIANAFGGGNINELLNILGSKQSRLPNDLMLGEYRDTINDYFGFMGLSWRIDWIATILEGQGVKLRS